MGETLRESASGCEVRWGGGGGGGGGVAWGLSEPVVLEARVDDEQADPLGRVGGFSLGGRFDGRGGGGGEGDHGHRRPDREWGGANRARNMHGREAGAAEGRG